MISVCVVTYNGEKYIRKQLESILSQLSPMDEIVISDDGSLDRTIDIIKQIGDDRIKIFYHVRANRCGRYLFEDITKNYIFAFSKAKGDVIFLCDQDDIWYPNKVQVVMQHMQQADVVVHDCRVVDVDGEELAESYFRLLNAKKGVIRNIIRCSYLGCCMAVTHTFLEKVFFPSNVPHDLWLAIAAESEGKLGLLPMVLQDYRRHPMTSSFAAKKNNTTLSYKLRYRFNIIVSYLKYILLKNWR